MQSITNIPASNVGQVVQDFVNDGAVRIQVQAEDNGQFTVTASWTT
jgi:hypothetical protein